MGLLRRLPTTAAGLLLAGAALAADAPATPAPGSEQKLDSLLQQQQLVLEGVQSLKRELAAVDLFPEGAWAATLNLPLLLASTAGDATMVSAALAWFPPHSRLEFTLPLWIRDQRDDSDFRATVVDLQGRIYLNPRRSGLYWLAGARSAWLDGRETDWWWGDDYFTGERRSLHKTGLYGGIGWRANSRRFYWNCNVAVGRYFGGEDVDLEADGALGGDLLIDAECFRFGLIF